MPPQSITPPTKSCRKCGESKPLDAYSRDRSKPDGRRNTCKACDALADKRPQVMERKRRHYHSEAGQVAEKKHKASEKSKAARAAYVRPEESIQRRKEYQPEASRRYHQSEKGKATYRAMVESPEYKEMMRERRQRPDVKEQAREYHQKHYHSPQYQAWLKEHKHKPEVMERRRNWARIYERARYSLKRSLLADFTEDEWLFALEWFDYRCVYCGTDGPLTQDHIVPVHSGGPYTASNLVPACRRCNASKSNKVMEEWATKEAQNRIYEYIAMLTGE
jgi:5-methylcytosine-specific restriction endonuclease McrA